MCRKHCGASNAAQLHCIQSQNNDEILDSTNSCPTFEPDEVIGNINFVKWLREIDPGISNGTKLAMDAPGFAGPAKPRN
jgi:hypothetical protein